MYCFSSSSANHRCSLCPIFSWSPHFLLTPTYRFYYHFVSLFGSILLQIFHYCYLFSLVSLFFIYLSRILILTILLNYFISIALISFSSIFYSLFDSKCILVAFLILSSTSKSVFTPLHIIIILIPKPMMLFLQLFSHIIN